MGDAKTTVLVRNVVTHWRRGCSTAGGGDSSIEYRIRFASVRCVGFTGDKAPAIKLLHSRVYYLME